jgi:hypothetical protein
MDTRMNRSSGLQPGLKGKNQMRFVADIMLGKLAKWLRVLGFDTLYCSFNPISPIVPMAQRGRIPLTRQKKLISLLEGGVFVQYNNVGDQLDQLKKALPLETCHARCFSRCIRCNVILMDVSEEAAQDNVPEYVFYKDMKSIRFCPGCGRYFWPGTHKIRMEKQLNLWGFKECAPKPD